MTKEKRNDLMFRWTAVPAVSVALFWGAWYLFTGFMPVIGELKMAPGDGMTVLAYAVPRWLECLLVPAGAVAIVQTGYLLGRMEEGHQSVAVAGLVLSFIFGLVFSLAYGYTVAFWFLIIYGGITGFLYLVMHGILATLIYLLLCGLVAVFMFVLTYATISCIIAAIAVMIGIMIKGTVMDSFWRRLAARSVSKTAEMFLWLKTIVSRH